MKAFLLNLTLFILVSLLGAILIWILGQMLWFGLPYLNLDFLLSSPESAGRAGGIAPIIVSTLLVLSITFVITLPIGLATALWLSEYAQETRMQSWLKLAIYCLAGVPSIVFGLFGNAFFSDYLNLGYSILSGGLTLSIMVLPFFIQMLWAGFSQIDPKLRKQSKALGLSQQTFILHILLPNTKPTIIAGFILSIGRACAETAALLFTSGFVDRYPTSVFDSGKTLSIHIYDLAMNITGGENNGYATALVLMMIIFIFNITARSIIYYQRSTTWQSPREINGRPLGA